ncbi:MAG: acyl-CoA dehydrogenase family protein [Planctomycetota bacterium]
MKRAPTLTEIAHRVGEIGERELAGLDETAAAYRALALLRAENLIAWTVPELYGGASTNGAVPKNVVSVRALCELRNALARHSGMLDLMLMMQGLGSFAIALGGSDELRREILPLVARGERIAAFAMTEPEAGSSVRDIATTAERTAHGYRLNGTKTFISNAGIAAFYTVLARTSGKPGDAEGMSMFYVPAASRGLTVERFEVMAPHPIGEVRFRDVDIERGFLLGEEGAGSALAVATLMRFRTTVASAAIGFARRAFDESCAYLKKRKQFGKPLATFQALRFDIAEMDVRLRAAELLVAEAVEAVDNGREARAEVARAKFFATETASFVCDRAVQHFGGLGVKRGTIVEALFREVRALRIYEGTSEIQRIVLAKELLDGER